VRDEDTEHQRLEWVLDAIERHSPAEKKRLILDARAPEIAILTDDQAERLIAALGLGGA
jgi:hypothetical protein